MAGETTITVVGNLTSDPELRYTQNGIAVAGFTIASTPRTFDKGSNEWKDGEALFLRCSAWRDLGEHVATSLTKGTRVIAQGNLNQRSFTDKDGNNRSSIELDVQAIGPDLTFATAQVTRAQKGQGGGTRQAPAQQAQSPYGQQPQQGAYPQGNYGTVPSYAGGSPTPPYQGQPQQGGYPPQAPQQGAWQYGDDTPF